MPFRKKGRRAPKIRDFLPRYFVQVPKRPQTIKELEDSLRGIAAWAKRAGKYGRKKKRPQQAQQEAELEQKYR